jgi:DNA polymerase-3 subunit delta
MIEDQVADSSRFDVFKLTDALLQGKLNRAVKILHGLKAEGIAAPVVLWAMSREARALINIGQALKQGGHQEAVYKKHQIFEQRKPLIHEALKRLKAADLQAILRLCATTDQQIKGQLAGDSWESLFNLCCLFTNTPMLSKL